MSVRFGCKYPPVRAGGFNLCFIVRTNGRFPVDLDLLTFLDNPHATGYIIPYIPDAKFGLLRRGEPQGGNS